MLRRAIQAGILADEIKDLLFLNVTPLSLGVVETLGEYLRRATHWISFPCSFHRHRATSTQSTNWLPTASFGDKISRSSILRRPGSSFPPPSQVSAFSPGLVP
jgi:hypothetical protein